MSVSAKNREPTFKGHRHSNETKLKISQNKKLYFSNSENRILVSEKTKIGMANCDYVDRVSKNIRLKNPSGSIIESKNISKFCRDNGLTNANVYKVLRGIIQHHKGWTLP
jgi:hypothetical protein